MAAGSPFGCPKITSYHTIMFIFVNCFTKWLPAAILYVRNSLLIAFLAILDQYIFIFFVNFWQNGCRRPFWMSEIHFRSHFWPFQINTKLFLQNGRRRPFWISEINFRSHFWPFQIDMQLYFILFFLTKWLPSAILIVRNSLSIAFLAILDKYINFYFFIYYKMAAGAHFGCPKFTFDRISGHFRSIWNFFFFNFDIMVSVGHFVCPKFTFYWISGHFRSIRNVIIFGSFWQNGCCRPFWMSEIQFRSHFWPFKINTDFFVTFLQNGRRRTYWIFKNYFRLHSGNFRSIGHFGCPKCRRPHLGCPKKITFDRISGHFRLIRNFLFWFFVDKMAAGSHFGWDDNVNNRTRPRYLDE